MARTGRAGLALATAALSSFVGGTIGTLLLATVAAPLASLAARFEAADYTALIVCGLVAAVVVAQGSVFKAIVMTGAGFALAMIGTDPATGQVKYTMVIPELVDGIGFMPRESYGPQILALENPEDLFAGHGDPCRAHEFESFHHRYS